jgi:transcriptional regulator with XRE-family HTH domain
LILADRIRLIRDQKPPSPQDNQNRSSLVDQYLLQLENGQTLPDIHTLEAWARALGVPMSRLFYESGKPPVLRYLKNRLTCEDIVQRCATL